jgi:hypothetical protein
MIRVNTFWLRPHREGSRMLRRSLLICTVLALQTSALAQAPGSKDAVRVEIVATASEYVPRSTTVSHPGHAYTNCLGSTSYFGRFTSYGDSGTFSGTADTNTHCNTTFTPPSESTLTTYQRVNYTIAKGDQALYLLSCTQVYKPTFGQRLARGVAAGAAGGSGRSSGVGDGSATTSRGKWTECPAFGIGGHFGLTVRNTSDARLSDAPGGKPIKLDYLSSAALPAQTPQLAPAQPEPVAPAGEAKVHVTSSPSGGEIYIDGKFFGNTPSDLTLAAGEHFVKVTIGGREWSRTVQISKGEIHLHAEMAEK